MGLNAYAIPAGVAERMAVMSDIPSSASIVARVTWSRRVDRSVPTHEDSPFLAGQRPTIPTAAVLAPTAVLMLEHAQ
jgi:hypothetical protein